MASTVVAAPVAVAKAFSPGHITGFFEVPKMQRKGGDGGAPYKGSTGAGFSIEKGISTAVHIFESRTGSEVLINGKVARPKDVEVSQWIVDRYFKENAATISAAEKPRGRRVGQQLFVRVEHTIEIPVGFGMGSSGAAALSLSYALNEALGIGKTMQEAAQLAHEAEIACGTGLGTVIAEYAGGFEMRLVAGGPGTGMVEQIPVDEQDRYKAAILSIAPISTKEFLSSRIDRIDGLGAKMLGRLQKTKSINEFLKMSYEFAYALGLTEGRCSPPIRALKEAGFDCSVALFGQTVFTIVAEEQIRKVKEIMQKFEGTLLVCGIDCNGARLIK